MDFEIPTGFRIQAGNIISRPAPRVRYPCSSCGTYRHEMMNPQQTRIHILECHVCHPDYYEAHKKFIKSGYKWRPSQ